MNIIIKEKGQNKIINISTWSIVKAVFIGNLILNGLILGILFIFGIIIGIMGF